MSWGTIRWSEAKWSEGTQSSQSGEPALCEHLYRTVLPTRIFREINASQLARQTLASSGLLTRYRVVTVTTQEESDR